MDKGNNIKHLYLKDTSFANLMQKRIFNVLLVASYYDAFILEEDGRVEEQIFFEYTSLNLSSPPRVTQVNNLEDAFKELSTKRFDLIIAIPDAEHSQTYEKAKEIKHHYPDIPIVLLTPFAREVSRRLEKEDLSGIDYVFSWLGNTDLLLAIIKLLEDEMNIEEDTKSGVQIIMLVEDSVRFYSSILPHLYKFVLKQSQIFSTEALNEHEQMLRMRGRPKIKLARSYEEAMEMYKKYANNILGIISDVFLIHFHRFFVSSNRPIPKTRPEPLRSTHVSSIKIPKNYPSICVRPSCAISALEILNLSIRKTERSSCVSKN